MKRKIEKFLASKQGIVLGPEESLPVGEEGHFDFMGDLEGVLLVRAPLLFNMLRDSCTANTHNATGPRTRCTPHVNSQSPFLLFVQAVRTRAPKGSREGKVKKVKEVKAKKNKKKTLDFEEDAEKDDEDDDDDDDDEDGLYESLVDEDFAEEGPQPIETTPMSTQTVVQVPPSDNSKLEVITFKTTSAYSSIVLHCFNFISLFCVGQGGGPSRESVFEGCGRRSCAQGIAEGEVWEKQNRSLVERSRLLLTRYASPFSLRTLRNIANSNATLVLMSAL